MVCLPAFAIKINYCKCNVGQYIPYIDPKFNFYTHQSTNWWFGAGALDLWDPLVKGIVT